MSGVDIIPGSELPCLAFSQKLPLSRLNARGESLRAGEALYLQERYAEAHAAFAAATAENPHLCDAWHGRGLASFRGGDLARATAELGCACALSAQYHHYYHYQGSHQHLRRGNLHLRLGTTSPALADYDQAIFLDHANAEAFFQRAHAHAALGDEARAAQDEEKALHLDPSLREHAGRAAPEIYDHDIALDFDYTRAVYLPEHLPHGDLLRDELERAAHPSSARAAGERAVSRRRFEEAAEHYTQAIAENPRDADAWHGRGVARSHAAGGLDDALADIAEAVALDDGNVSVHHDRAVMLHRKRRYRDAIEAFGEAVARQPEHSNAHFGRGRVWLALGENRQALADFDRAIELSARQHDFYHRQASLHHLSRGHAFFRRDQVDLALNDYAKATDLCREHADAWRARGDGYYRKGDFGEALMRYETALALMPGDAELERLTALTEQRMRMRHVSGR